MPIYSTGKKKSKTSVPFFCQILFCQCIIVINNDIAREDAVPRSTPSRIYVRQHQTNYCITAQWDRIPNFWPKPRKSKIIIRGCAFQNLIQRVLVYKTVENQVATMNAHLFTTAESCCFPSAREKQHLTLIQAS